MRWRFLRSLTKIDLCPSNRVQGMSSVLLAALFAIVDLSLATQASAAKADWSKMAMSDLQAAHDLIEDNHPGPVDPENPAFRQWLDRGEVTLLPQARGARSQHDYRQVLLDYLNGFADAHLFMRFAAPEQALWPGFLTRTDRPDGLTQVVLVTGASGVAMGDVLESCDSTSVRDLLASRVLRPLTNSDAPQRLILTSPRLMVVSNDEIADRAAHCALRDHAGHIYSVAIRWHRIPDSTLQEKLQQASGVAVPPLGLHKVGDVWLISLPSFTWVGHDAARMEALVASLRSQATALHGARHVVLDLRGNGGGNSAWGEDIASALWSRDAVEAVEASQDGTVDWRTSSRNIATILSEVVDMRQASHSDEAARWDRLASQMRTARAAGDVLLRIPDPATRRPPHLVSPFAHPVLIVTDPHCVSACLDFLDLLNRLPRTERIGLPTSADTDYLDLAFAPLPSGQASVAYAMKVYRHRARGSNVAYAPAITWPGGVMTDASLSRWVDTLSP